MSVKYEYEYEYEYEKEHNENVEKLVKELEELATMDYKEIVLADIPTLIKDTFELTKEMFNLPGSEKLMLIKDALKVIIDKTDATGAFESSTVILIPKIIDAIIKVNENGSLELVDRKKPGKFVQKILICAQGCIIDEDVDNQIEDIKDEKQDIDEIERNEIKALDEKYKNDVLLQKERHRKELIYSTTWWVLPEGHKPGEPVPHKESKKATQIRHKKENENLKDMYTQQRIILIDNQKARILKEEERLKNVKKRYKNEKRTLHEKHKLN